MNENFELPVGKTMRWWRQLPWLLALCGLLLSAQLYRINVQMLAQQQRTYFDFRVREAVDLIETRMAAYQQVLRGVRGLFETQAEVSREEFRAYVEHQALTENYPGIQGVGYAQLVRPARLAAHLDEIRRQGHPDYRILPDGPRDVYSSIVYLEPFWGRNLRAFGYDMYSEPVRRQAMQRSADTGVMALSRKVRLMQEDGGREQAGFLIYQAVYNKTVPSEAEVTQPLAGVRGWVYAPFRMNDFLHGVMGERAAELLLSVYDGERLSPETRMYEESSLDGSDPGHFEATRSLHAMGHVWTLQLRSTDAMHQRFNNQQPLIVGLGGALLSLLLAAITWMLVNGRERAILTAREMNDSLIAERARLNAILAGTNVGTWEWNVQTGETRFNAEWAHIVGYELAELEPVSIDTWMRLVHPDDLAQSQQKLEAHFRGETPYYDCEARMRHKDGHWIWVLDRGKLNSRTDQGAPLMMYGTHQDITERKNKEQSYRREAHHDQLTGLPNRLLLADRLDRTLLGAQRDKSRVALMFMDLDGFKQVNDTHGHDAGDLVLRTMARRIQSALRASDTLARIGGDEFVVLLPDIGDAGNARVLAAKIAAEACRPIRLDASTTVTLSLSIGIALYPEHGETAALLTTRADRAMYKAKKGGKNAAVVYEDGWAPSETVPGLLA